MIEIIICPIVEKPHSNFHVVNYMNEELIFQLNSGVESVSNCSGTSLELNLPNMAGNSINTETSSLCTMWHFRVR